MIALWLAACVTGPGEALELPDADRELFAEQVQPVLAAGCANPSCHGNGSRPLSVYAEDRWRLDPEATFLDEPLTDEELAHNYASAVAFVVGIDHPLDSDLLLEPLAEEAGGTHHEGGVQFADRSEPDFLDLKDWVAAALEAP